jgi:hypothetical protein
MKLMQSFSGLLKWKRSLAFLYLFCYFFCFLFSLLKEAIDDSIFIVYKYKVGKAL